MHLQVSFGQKSAIGAHQCQDDQERQQPILERVLIQTMSPQFTSMMEKVNQNTTKTRTKNHKLRKKLMEKLFNQPGSTNLKVKIGRNSGSP